MQGAWLVAMCSRGKVLVVQARFGVKSILARCCMLQGAYDVEYPWCKVGTNLLNTPYPEQV